MVILIYLISFSSGYCFNPLSPLCLGLTPSWNKGLAPLSPSRMQRRTGGKKVNPMDRNKNSSIIEISYYDNVVRIKWKTGREKGTKPKRKLLTDTRLLPEPWSAPPGQSPSVYILGMMFCDVEHPFVQFRWGVLAMLCLGCLWIPLLS